MTKITRQEALAKIAELQEEARKDFEECGHSSPFNPWGEIQGDRLTIWQNESHNGDIIPWAEEEFDIED